MRSRRGPTPADAAAAPDVEEVREALSEPAVEARSGDALVVAAVSLGRWARGDANCATGRRPVPEWTGRVRGFLSCALDIDVIDDEPDEEADEKEEEEEEVEADADDWGASVLVGPWVEAAAAAAEEEEDEEKATLPDPDDSPIAIMVVETDRGIEEGGGDGEVRPVVVVVPVDEPVVPPAAASPTAAGAAASDASVSGDTCSRSAGG
jgi:hypothetical protein